MTIEEVFGQVSKHMIDGIMIHSQLADYYNFIGLKGYSKCHEYHFLTENNNFRKLCCYYIKHFNKLIPELPNDNPRVIPANWYNYSRVEVDGNTRKNAIQGGIEKWVNWEYKTKVFYQSMHSELMKLHEVAAAAELKKYISDVDYELAYAQQRHLEDKAIDYDIFDILAKQERIYEKYKKKIEKMNCE